MSSRGSSSNTGGRLQSIPPASRKMVQSLKEIVNCSEAEIYAMLKECNMDLNETVNRLLSQDPFHEVKSKRDKKKENGDTVESKPRVASSSSNRGSRSGSDHYVGHGSSTQSSSSESGALHGKSAYKKENGINTYTGVPPAASGMASNNLNMRSPALSDPVSSENKVATIGTGDGNWSFSQAAPGCQPAWSGTSGHISMVDIVKMGRPPGKSFSTVNSSQHVNHHHVQAPRSGVSNQNMHSSKDLVPKLPEIDPEPGVGTGQHISPDDDWPVVEQPPAASVPSVLEPVASHLHVEMSNVSTNSFNQHQLSQADAVRLAEDAASENINVSQPGSPSVSSRKIQEDNAGSTSLVNNGLYSDSGSYQLHRHAFEPQDAEETGTLVTLVTRNLQHLSVQEDQGLRHEEDNPSVIIPDHLQVQTVDCLHLSFGSFGSGISAALSGAYSSRPLKSNLEEASADADALSVGHSDNRNVEYYRDESLRIASDGNIGHGTSANSGNYDSPSVSQHEVLKEESADVSRESQYTFPSSTSDYNYESGQTLNDPFPHSQSSSQLQNLPPFSSVMQQAYTNSLPSSLLASNVQPARDSDLPYSPFPLTQSMPTKYGNTLSSISGSITSMPEALKTVSSTQPAAQNLPGNNIATGPAFPQHLAVHPYSQPTLPLGPFANMISYPFLPQSYTYLPPALQQPFAGNSAYHQSLAALLPQYKNSVSVSSLPQSATIASGYGALENSTSVPSNFPMNAPSTPGATTIGYDDVIGSQYKDNNLLISLQQNENSAMWVHGPGSRTISVVPPNTFYSFQGQSQQNGGLRQTLQPSQGYGALGYPNFYHSQAGISPEHGLQNARDPLTGTQGQPSKQSEQMWQNGY